MEKGIVLTPEELYYLGTLLKARYIDYAYVAAMDDIGQNYSLFEKETGAALVRKGILREDFSGKREISEPTATWLRPIFFGETETSMDVCEIGEKNKVSVFKFHFYGGAVTMVCGEEGKLRIAPADPAEIRNRIAEMVPENYSYEAKTFSSLPRETVTRFFAFKSIIVGQTTQVKTFIEASGLLYREKNEKEVESVDRDAFIQEAFEVIKGV